MYASFTGVQGTILQPSRKVKAHGSILFNGAKEALHAHSPLVLAAALLAPLAAQPKPQYEVYAIQYATLSDFPVSSLIAGADRARKMTSP